MFTFSEVQYENFGTCVKLENGAAELLVSVENGPRIISYRLRDGGNVFFNDVDRVLSNDSPELEVYGPGAKWNILGGHRLWLSPESLVVSYDPGVSPIRYTHDENSITVTNEQQPLGIRKSMQVILDESDAGVTVVHTLENIGDEVKTFAPWAISVMDKGGISFFPVPQTCLDSFLSNKTVALWSYSRMNDPRVYWGDRIITLRQDPAADGPFKLGINQDEGWACYLNNGCAFVKKFSPNITGNYPDGGCNYETYSCADFLEVESLGELCTLEPGQICTHEERWDLFEVPEMPDTSSEESMLAFAERHIL